MSAVLPQGSVLTQRMLNEHNLTASAAVQTPTNTPNASGGYSTTFATSATLPCRLGIPSSSGERSGASRTEELSEVLVSFAAGTQISNSARLVVTWDDAGVSRTVTLSIIGRKDLRSRSTQASYVCEVVR